MDRGAWLQSMGVRHDCLFCNLKNKQHGLLGKLRHQDTWGAGWKAPLAVVLRGACLCSQT